MSHSGELARARTRAQTHIGTSTKTTREEPIRIVDLRSSAEFQV